MPHTRKWPRFLILTLLLLPLLACQLGEPATIQGTVSSTDGSLPAHTFVVLFTADDYKLITKAPLAVGQNGAFSIPDVPADKDHVLLTVPISGENISGYNLHGYTPRMELFHPTGETLTHEVSITPCHDYIFEIYQPDGSLIDNDNWIGTRFAVNMDNNATLDFFSGIDKGENTLSVPNVCLPIGETRRFFFQVTLPDFGKVVLAADNAGAGYIATAPGGTVLNLNYEIARSQVQRLADNLSEYRAAGYNVPASFNDKLTEVEKQLAQTKDLIGAEQAAAANSAAGTALWALEELELARAEQDIPRYRMGDLQITVLDASGAPIPNATVSYQQTSHDFLFGIFDTVKNVGTESYRLMQDAGINYVTTGFYWNEVEPKQNKIAWEKIDHDIGVLDLHEMGFTLKSHALLALWDFGLPEYVLEMPFEEFNQKAYEHISELVEHYKDEIEIWNVINEASGRGAALDFNREEINTLTRTGIRAIRENDPNARIIINSAFDWYGETKNAELLLGGNDNFTLSNLAYLDQLQSDGIEYDIIGQQLYNGGMVTIFAEWGLADEPFGVPVWDLAHHAAIMDRLDEYGKPVHITEQSVSSTWSEEFEQSGAGWWHKPWDGETQAEFVYKYYTIAFSKSNMEAVTWWNINDNYSFIVDGGLLDKDNKPKASYYALRDLIASWTSSGDLTTNTAGQASIRGYGGEYTFTISNGTQTWQETVHIHEQQKNEIVIRVGK
jgi:endo-1,4-beta-xylanase